MEQKRKVKSLISGSKAEELSVLSRFLIVLSGIFFFGALTLFTFSMSFVDAASIPVFTGLDENQEVVYELDFAEKENLSDVKAKIYMKSNQIGKDNLYIEPYSVVVTKKTTAGESTIGTKDAGYINLLGGNELKVVSTKNVSMIGGFDLNITKSDNATLLGGEKHKIANAGLSVLVGGAGNALSGKASAILGGGGNEINGQNSFILGGYGNNIVGNRVVVAGINVRVEGKSDVFVFSNDNNVFKPQKSNTFYINAWKGLGLNMDATQGVASSGAVSFGLIGNAECNSANYGLIGLSGTCLYGCTSLGWNKIGCFEEKWGNPDDFEGYCTGSMRTEVNNTVNGNNLRYAWCGETPKNYKNVIFETKLWTGEGCPTIKAGENPCVYACAEGHHYDKASKKCKKDCQIPWDGSGVVHGTFITGYREESVVCEEKQEALGCENVKAVLQCNDGVWVYNTGAGGKPVYSNNSNKIEDIRYKYKTCTTKENKCNTGVYQYTTNNIQYWKGFGDCTDHTVKNNMCEKSRTIYTGRCYINHTLTGKNCKLGVNTLGCICEPNTRLGNCSNLPNNAIGVSTTFVQTASGDFENNWRPTSKSYVLYTGNDKTECTYKCKSGYSYLSGKCLLDCEHDGKTYKNGETIPGYKTGAVACTKTTSKCEPTNLVCYNGTWSGGAKTCKTTDKLCSSSYRFSEPIPYADCSPCRLYSGSQEGNICTDRGLKYSCKCWSNSTSGYYEMNDAKTACVPADRDTECSGKKPGGNVVFYNSKTTFTQTWSGGIHKWIPESISYHTGLSSVCGFACASNNRFDITSWSCIGTKCLGDFDNAVLVPNSNINLGEEDVQSKLFKNLQAALSGGKCAYYCKTCYSKDGNQCKPNNFTVHYKCKNSSLNRSEKGTQTFTYGESTKINVSCNDMAGYKFLGWSTGPSSTTPKWQDGTSLTINNYSGCSNSRFYAVYECTTGYHRENDECVSNHKTVSMSCGVAPTGEGYKLGTAWYTSNCEWLSNGWKCENKSRTYTGSSNPGICEYTCNTNYKRENGQCVPNGKCIGSFNNAEFVTGSDNNLVGDTQSTLYKTLTDAGNNKCAYVCSSGFTYVLNGGTPQCVKCLSGYQEGTTCIIDLDCEKNYGSDYVQVGNECVPYGSCFADYGEVRTYETQKTVWGIYQSKEEVLPKGTSGQWKCKDAASQVTPNSCEFSCPAGRHCDGDICIPDYMCWQQRSISDEKGSANTDGYINLRNPNSSLPNTDGVINFTLTSISDIESKIKNNVPGCYVACKPGYHEVLYNSWRYYYCAPDLNCVYENHGNAKEYKVAPRDEEHTSWYYAEPENFENAKKSYDCVWTCEVGYPVKSTEIFEKASDSHWTCWHKCPDGQYHNTLACVSPSLGYEVDKSKTVSYNGITNYSAQKLIDCGTNGVFNNDRKACLQKGSLSMEQCLALGDGWEFYAPKSQCVKCMLSNQKFDYDIGQCVDG